MKWDDVLPLVLVVIVSLDVPFNRRAGGFSGIVSAPRLPVVSRSFGEPDMLEQRMWCEDFLSAYRSAPVDHMAKYYDRLSVLVEATGDGRWTEPAIGAQKIADRLASLNASSGCGWPVVACQLTRSDGLIVVLAAEDGYQRQILIVHWLVASRRAVVSNHFYLNTTFNGEHEGGESPNDGELHVESFHSRFEGWAGRQDRRSLVRFQTALCTGLTVVRDYYTAPPGYPTDRRLYDHAARFSCIRPDGSGGGHVYTGPQAISKQYGRLAMDNRYVRLRTVETCWSGYSSSISGTAVTLTAGVVPKAGRASAYREFVQLFVIDVRTRKIINDVLCFEPRSHTLTTSTTFKIGVSSSSLSSSLSSSSSYATSSSYTTSTTSLTLPPPLSSSSSLSKSPSRQPPHPFSYTTFTSSNPLFSFFYPSTSPCSDSLLSNKIDDRLPNMFAGVSDENGADSRPYHSELTALRSRFTANTLGIRFAAICSPCASGAGASVGSGSQPQQNVTSSKVNPRQLFIGCVPLHVKYGQLKLLFEQFGEVTYVKVYEGYNKQTGAKMLHNYAFLFFKDEKSVEKAISASPIPLDSNWNLNVSRPHHHTTTVGASDR